MGGGTHGSVLIALPDELLLHIQLLLAQHPGKGFLGLGAGQAGLVEVLTAQRNGLVQIPLQQAHVPGELCVAGAALLPPGPEADAGHAVAQPGGALGLQLPGSVLGGIQLVQNIGQQVKILHLFRGALAQVVVEIQIQAALGGVVQQLRTGQRFHRTGSAPVTVAQVGHGQRMVQHQLAVVAGRGSILFVLLGQGRGLDHLHRLGQQQILQQVVEPAGGELLPQGSKQLVGVEQQGRVAGVEPAGGGIDDIQHTVGQAARALQGGKLHGVQAGQQQFLGDAPCQQIGHSLFHASCKFGGSLCGGPPQHQLQRGLQGAVVKANVNIRAQLLLQQSCLQRGLVGAQQGIQQDLHAQLALPVSKRAGVPGQRTLHLIQLGVFGVVRDVHTHTVLLVLHRQSGAAGALGHPAQVVLIQKRQLLGHIHLAVQGDAAVVGAVMAAVHPLVFFIGQGRDGGRVAAGHKAVGRIREHGPLQRVLQLRVRGGQRTLHLIVDHTAHRAVRVPVPALLLEHGLVHHGQRAEHGVQVHVHQVPEVGLVGGGKGIHGLVREGHGVQEGGHTALEQLQKRRGHGVLLAARQHRVLQNVEHTGVVGGEGAEADAERLVGVLVLHQQDSGPAHIVVQNRQRTVLLRAVLAAHQRITGIVHVVSPLGHIFSKCLALLYHAFR